MCTVVLLRRPGHDWPLILAGNRDEMADRPWLPPGRHWPLAPDVVGGYDVLAEGSWLALNGSGVVATILNRTGSLGPLQGKRSRGELVLQALDHADAAAAADSLTYLQAKAYRPFNLVVADNRDAFWLKADGERVLCSPIGDGVSMLTAADLNDPEDPRIRRFLPAFAAAAPPDPARVDSRDWQTLLAQRAQDGVINREAGLTFQLDNGFGTRSSAVIALPSMQRAGVKPCFLFAAGPPDRHDFARVLL